MPSRRSLYVGNNLAFLEYLQRALLECQLVRCPDGKTARLFMARLDYCLLLVDEELPDTTGRELAEFNCSLERQPCTPFIIVKKSDDFELLTQSIREVWAS